MKITIILIITIISFSIVFIDKGLTQITCSTTEENSPLICTSSSPSPTPTPSPSPSPLINTYDTETNTRAIILILDKSMEWEAKVYPILAAIQIAVIFLSV